MEQSSNKNTYINSFFQINSNKHPFFNVTLLILHPENNIFKNKCLWFVEILRFVHYFNHYKRCQKPASYMYFIE